MRSSVVRRPLWTVLAADRRVALAGAAVAALIIVALAPPWGPRMIDMEVYRTGAQALLSGVDMYSVGEATTGLPFTYPAFAAVVFVPFAIVPRLVARAAITGISLAALLLICHLTVRAVRPAQALRWTIPVALIAIASHPVSDTLLFGQINLILVAMVLADILLVRGPWRGVLVGVATGIKLTPGLFIVYYLVTGRYREARNAALATAATVAIGFAVQPAASWAYWTRHIFNPARMGNVLYTGNQSILATTARLMRQPYAPPALTLGLAALVVVAALVVARRLARTGEELAAVCVVAAASLLASPISWTHHWVWFIPCLAVVATSSTWPGRWLVLGVAAVDIWLGPMRFMPHNDLRELHHNLGEQIITNSFAGLAVAFIAWAAWSTRTPAPAVAPTVG